ncbi:MAG: AMP-binding protein [Myxococcota bacterium]
MGDGKLLLDYVYGHEKGRADAVYMTQPLGGGRTEDYSWARVMDESRRVASFLKSKGWPPGSTVAIVSKNCAHFVMTELAIWMAGYTTVALYPTLNAETVAYTLEHCEAKMLFVGKLDEAPWEEMKRGIPDTLPRASYPLSRSDVGADDADAWKDIIANHDPIEGEPSRDPDDIALIIYTSGSTGRPKGVMHSFNNISHASRMLAKTFNVGPDDRMLSYLPIAHAMERWLGGTLPMVSGLHLYFAESLATFVQDLGRARPTVFASVPRLWLKFQLGVYQKMPPERLGLLMKIPIVNGIIKKKILGNLGLDAVRVCGSGSAPIPPELIQWYRDLGLEMLEGYGMSENFNYSHLSMPGRTRVGYVGEAWPDIDVKLSDEGEVLVKSPTNMVGYLKDEEKTAEAFTEDGYLRTGDRGEIDDQGRLKITGRVKEIFKTSKGKFVVPAPIENMINNHPRVELSCVSGLGRPAPYAVLQLAEGLDTKIAANPGLRGEIEGELRALLAHVNEEVEVFERLDFLAVAAKPWTIEDGHLTPTMKIKRGAIEDIFNDKLDDWYGQKKQVVWEQG